LALPLRGPDLTGGLIVGLGLVIPIL
jgi:hypothetical protein